MGILLLSFIGAVEYQTSSGSERRLGTIKMLRTFAHSLPARNALRVNYKASLHELGTSWKYGAYSR